MTIQIVVKNFINFFEERDANLGHLKTFRSRVT